MHSATALLAAGELGGYVSLLKLLPVIVLLFLWARMMTWIDKDTVAAHLPREIFNTALFAAGLLAFALFFLLPGFWIALGVLVFILIASFAAYLIARHQQVGLSDLMAELSNWRSMFAGKKKVQVKAGEVGLFTKGGQAMTPPEDKNDPEAPGYTAAQSFVTDPLKKGAERIEVRPSDGASNLQYVVDGVAYNAGDMDRAAAAAGITYMKKAAGLDIEDRRKPQTGVCKAVLDGKRHELEVSTAGSTAGESLRIVVNPKKRYELRLDTLGMPPEQMGLMQAAIAEPRGIVIVCAPKQQGLTTLLYATIRAHDAFLTHIQTIEHGPKADLEGITQNKLPVGAPAAEEFKLVEWVASQEPDVLLVDELTSRDSARELIRYAGTGKRAYIGMRAGSTFDALAAWRKLVGDDNLAVEQLAMIVSGRVLRRLCMACKVGYAPDPDTLKKLNMDPARVTQLFQARTQPLMDHKGRPLGPCTFCQDLRYKGLFGIYEMFLVDDEVRQIVASGSSVNQLKTAFRKQRGRYLQETALSYVEAGDTSIQEVLRVLRGSEQTTSRSTPQPQPR